MWGGGEAPLYENHDIDVYYLWPCFGNFWWAEQSVFGLNCMNLFKKPYILELGCSDGFFAANIYLNVKDAKYVGCDMVETAILDARIRSNRRRNNESNAVGRFIVADFLRDMPCENEPLTNVFWFASIYMFSEAEQNQILLEVSKRLKKRAGILSGSALLKDVLKEKYWKYWVKLFDDENELRILLLKYFRNVYIGKTSTEFSVFFMASDGELPYYNKR